ncbi:MAG: HAD-IA family hydrolase, partial [Candidatus Dormibacteraeota bacterium]|nr:HAD-IA family hydrolase [Candidatus Dormibacteraeota bacterium]
DVHDRVEREFLEHQASGALEEIDLVAATRRAYADLGLALDATTLDEVLRLEQLAWWEGVSLDPEAIPTLDALRRRGLRVGLCSNAPYRVRSMHDQIAHFGLDRHLDSVTFSGEVGWRKPSPRIFAAALRALGATAAATLMVGDSVRDDVEGARAAGISALLLRRAGRETGEDSASGSNVIHHLAETIEVVFGTACL